ncbi:MAG: type II toxin-antitoxin system PemK/MazF family toxin, partial [Mycobacterium sp.]|nr:type II toxin-antitoxin system PemK/MazF family toxin [Mycobacterium sp.]
MGWDRPSGDCRRRWTACRVRVAPVRCYQGSNPVAFHHEVECQPLGGGCRGARRLCRAHRPTVSVGGGAAGGPDASLPDAGRRLPRRGTNGRPNTTDHGPRHSATGWPVLRGEIWQVYLTPVRGSEADKQRPAIVVSNDRANGTAARLGRGFISVVPITSNADRVYPFQVLLSPGPSGLTVESKAQAEQVRSIA